MSKYFHIWTQIGEIVDDLGAPYVTCAAWVRRGEIPRSYDGRLMEVLKLRGLAITYAGLDHWHRDHAARRKKLRKLGGNVEAQDILAFPPFPWCREDSVEAAQ